MCVVIKSLHVNERNMFVHFERDSIEIQNNKEIISSPVTLAFIPHTSGTCPLFYIRLLRVLCVKRSCTTKITENT